MKITKKRQVLRSFLKQNKYFFLCVKMSLKEYALLWLYCLTILYNLFFDEVADKINSFFNYVAGEEND
jgi:hypothetical protein